MEWKKYNYEYEGLSESLSRIDKKLDMLNSKRPIPSIAVKSIKESLELEWTYNSNSIEGNTMTLRETQLVLHHGFTIHGKSLREHFEAVNHQEAIEYVENLISDSYKIKISEIMNIHAIVLQKIEREYSGRFRTGRVMISGANFIPPNPLKVSDYIDELMYWFENEDTHLHPMIKASIFHHRFVWIHPFFDGNGRTVRLAFNLYLMNLGYPPVIILKNDRKKYYNALNAANNGDYSKLLLMMIQASERTLDIYVNSLFPEYEEYVSIQTIVSEPDIPYGQEYVSLLARRGRIDAYKQGRDWVTTKAAVKNYITKRKRERKLKS